MSNQIRLYAELWYGCDGCPLRTDTAICLHLYFAITPRDTVMRTLTYVFGAIFKTFKIRMMRRFVTDETPVIRHRRRNNVWSNRGCQKVINSIFSGRRLKQYFLNVLMLLMMPIPSIQLGLNWCQGGRPHSITTINFIGIIWFYGPTATIWETSPLIFVGTINSLTISSVNNMLLKIFRMINKDTYYTSDKVNLCK